MSGLMFQTLRFRSTAWHTLIFAAMALVIFWIAYQTAASQLLSTLGTDLEDTATEFSDLYQSGGKAALRTEIASEALAHDRDKFFARIINPQGQTILLSQPPSWSLPLPEPAMHPADRRWQDVKVNQHGESAHILSVRSHDGGWIQVGMSLQGYKQQLQQIIRMFGWSLILVVITGVLTGWWQVRHVLAAVDQVRRTAMEIGAGDLDSRLVLDGHGQELVELAGVFNTMLDRIQQLLGEMRDVSDHIAHDLRTPVARIRGLAESSLLEHGSTVAKEEALAAVIEESDRLSAMINTMLEIAQADAGLTQLEAAMVDIAGLLAQAHELFLPVAEDAGIEMRMAAVDAPLELTGDASRLQRLIANLLDNAIKFTPAGGHISSSAQRANGAIELCITDTGMGVSASALPHLFERFYRADNSRSTPGNGLGLSYAQSIARAHGGNIRIDSQAGQGTIVTVHLPV